MTQAQLDNQKLFTKVKDNLQKICETEDVKPKKNYSFKLLKKSVDLSKSKDLEKPY